MHRHLSLAPSLTLSLALSLALSLTLSLTLSLALSLTRPSVFQNLVSKPPVAQARHFVSVKVAPHVAVDEQRGDVKPKKNRAPGDHPKRHAHACLCGERRQAFAGTKHGFWPPKARARSAAIYFSVRRTVYGTFTMTGSPFSIVTVYAGAYAGSIACM